MNRFANYTVHIRPRGAVVRTDASGKQRVARFADGTPAVFVCAKDAYQWIMFRISHHIGVSVLIVEKRE